MKAIPCSQATCKAAGGRYETASCQAAGMYRPQLICATAPEPGWPLVEKSRLII